MEIKRKPFQGLINIISFNRHFYISAGAGIIALLALIPSLPEMIQPVLFWLLLLVCITIIVSLLVSFFVYDLSDFYQLKWLPNSNNKRILNINAGFDESSEIIMQKFPDSELITCDFYDPEKHTEISIKRARRAYPPCTNTIRVSTNRLPFQNDSFDFTLAILTAHEIRDEIERVHFFKELNRVTKPDGQIFITEHLRDLNNFFAYTIGFFHFYSKTNWLCIFNQANLKVKCEVKSTPFITTFTLIKNGDTP